MGQEKVGITNESVIKAMGLYGGGIAASGHACGALLGAVASLSCIYSRGALDEQEHPRMREVGGMMVKRFEELTAQHGGIRCQDIARVNWHDPDAVKQHRSSPDSRRKICVQLVGDTAEALGHIIDRETHK